MAENTQDQTRYANPDTGEVPIASKPDIVRENSYPPPPPPPSPATQALNAISNAPDSPTTPLSQSDYTKYQIKSGEGRKDTVAREATNLASAQDENARINHQAYVDHQFSLYGNPEKLHQAQQNLAAAQALPPNDPSRTAQIATAQQEIMTNEGSRPALMRAMADANRRDEELRAQIRAAQAQKIDPDRWWNSKSTEGKILAGIGMVLGGIGGGLAKTGRNPAMDVMNNAISQDIDAQKHDIDNQWKAIANQHGLDNDAFNRELHRQVWENNYRTSALETVKYKLAESAAKTNSETVKNNAVNMIQDINDQQAKIRNDQWRLAVQAQQAEIGRRRALSAQADKDVQALMASGKYTYEEASDVVYNRPHMKELIGYGLAPANVAYGAVLRTQYASDLAKVQKNAATLGLKEGTPQYKSYMELNDPSQNPKYAPIFKSVGPEQAPDITMKQMGEAEKPKDLDARTVGYNKDGTRILAASAEQANEYKAKMGAAQQWERNATELQALYRKSEGDPTKGIPPQTLTVEELARWNALRADMIAVYGVMKEGSKKLPNQQEAENLKENVIGNPPNQWSAGSLVSGGTDMSAKVKARMDNLTQISNEARNSANLALQKSGGPTTPGTSGTPASGNTGNSGKQYGTTVKP